MRISTLFVGRVARPRTGRARLLLMPALALLVLPALAGQALANPPEMAGMEQGRKVWLGSCGLCHAEPASGAPQIGDKKAWAPRIGKGVEKLYVSALEGHVGPMGDEMPARGGNPSLADDEVKAAVDYMVAVAAQ